MWMHDDADRADLREFGLMFMAGLALGMAPSAFGVGFLARGGSLIVNALIAAGALLALAGGLRLAHAWGGRRGAYGALFGVIVAALGSMLLARLGLARFGLV